MPADTKNFQSFRQACQFLQQESANIFGVQAIRDIIPKSTDYREGDVQDAAIKHFFQDTFSPLVQELERRCQDHNVRGAELFQLFQEPLRMAGQAMSAIGQADKIAKQAQDAVASSAGNASTNTPGYSAPYKPITSQPLHIETEALIEINFLLKYQHKFSPEEIVQASQEVVNRARAQAPEYIVFSNTFTKLDTVLQMANDMVSSGQNVSPSTITRIAQAVQEGLNPPEVTREAARGYEPPSSQRSGNFRS